MIKRCLDGFPKGMCRNPACPHFEGFVDLESSITRCCEACGAATKHTLCADCTANPAVHLKRNQWRQGQYQNV